MEEADHIIHVLKSTKEALNSDNSDKLNELSNQTIHSASCFQDAGSISIAIIVYSLSKIVQRKDHLKIKNWTKFVSKTNNFLELAIRAVKENNVEKYAYYLELIRKGIVMISGDIKTNIQEIFRKASINKGSKIYDHGISLGRTAQILGITNWELSDYVGQSNANDSNLTKTLDVRQRAKMALEFIS